MKFKVFALALCTFIAVDAQENPKDKAVETTTRIIKVKDNGKTVEKKIMVKTIETQEVKTDPSQKGSIDADRVFPDKKVEKVIYIDNDDDPFYDGTSKIAYYKQGNMRYNFNLTNSGFDYKSEDNSMSGQARMTNNSDVYLVDTETYSGIGYFEDDKFVVEFYDDDGMLTIERFDKIDD